MLSLRFGAGEESRTLDLNLAKVALYQLSYSRKTSAHYRDIRMPVNIYNQQKFTFQISPA